MPASRKPPTQDQEAIAQQIDNSLEAQLIAVPPVNAAEVAAQPAAAPRVAEGYVHATHPDTGLQVVFVRGERLPAWVPSD